MPPLLSTWDLVHSTPEPHTQIHVRNLSTILPLSTDAWGRPSKQQPVLLSASVSLRQPFTSSSSSDTVADTIHYGLLSKALLAACEEYTSLCRHDASMPVPMHLRALMNYIHFYLTRTDTLPRYVNPARIRGKDEEGEKQDKPLLRCEMMEMLAIEITLPKASLLGEGVSLKGCFTYDLKEEGPIAYSMRLSLKNLHVPAIIGVNDNERRAKQMVIATVEMDRWDRMSDAYCELEEFLTKSVSESAFQTLEALSTHLCTRIIRYFLQPYLRASRRASAQALLKHQLIRVRLAKPTAVTLAEAPVVEMMVNSDPETGGLAREVWDQGGKGIGGGLGRAPPFPLQGSLEEWIKEDGGEGVGG